MVRWDGCFTHKEWVLGNCRVDALELNQACRDDPRHLQRSEMATLAAGHKEAGRRGIEVACRGEHGGHVGCREGFCGGLQTVDNGR